MLHLILTSLGHTNKYVNTQLWRDQFGVKGHVEVTEIGKVIFTKKNAISFLD